MAWIVTSPFSTASRKWWYFKFMCLVWGHIFGVCAIANAPELSSNTLQWTSGILMENLNPAVANSDTSLIRGRTSRRAWDSETYSLSVELKAISVCSLDAQTSGQSP
jgi:hypothetical protein